MVGRGLQSQAEKMEKRAIGRTRHGEKSGPKWRDLGVLQEVPGFCAVSGIQADEQLQARKERHERVRETVEKHLQLEKGNVPDRNAKGWNVEREKRRVTRKESTRLLEEFEVGGCMAQNVLWNIAKKSMLEDRGALLKEEEILSENTRPRTKKTFSIVG